MKTRISIVVNPIRSLHFSFSLAVEWIVLLVEPSVNMNRDMHSLQAVRMIALFRVSVLKPDSAALLGYTVIDRSERVESVSGVRL